ncbi:MAG: hypothetical protein IKL50_05865, partial [Bacteroidales bacterium]|nr:hypothetical protein [Bacteroidales bacterium]
MKKRISLKLFLTVLWRGICQAFGFIPKLLGYKDESTYVRAIWKILITCVAIVATIITCGFLYCFGVDIVYDKWIKPYIQESNIYWTQYLSNHIVFQEMSTGTGRIYDTTRDKVLLKRVC